MPKRSTLYAASLVVVTVVAVILGACSKSSSPTYPTGGGGGGGGGTLFNLTFPATGVSQSFTFTTAGTFGYRCAVHGNLGMTGTVVVSDVASADSDTVAVGRDSNFAQALSYKPSTVTIKTGGTVRWINRSAMTNHTVTYP